MTGHLLVNALLRKVLFQKMIPLRANTLAGESPL